VRARLVAPPQSLEALAQRVVGVGRRRVELEQLFERCASRLVLSRVEVRPTERLEDGCLPRLGPIGALEDDRRLGVVPAIEQRVAALEQLVGRLLGRVLRAALVTCFVLVFHGARDGGTEADETQ
jgi:hypothetical protein